MTLKTGKLIRRAAVPMLLLIIATAFCIGVTSADFVDAETSDGNAAGAWSSTRWTQTSQADFNSGVTSSVDLAASPGDAMLALVPNLTMVTSDDSAVATGSSSSAQLVKTLYFTRSGSSFDQLRIDSDLKIIAGTDVTSSIRLNGTEIFSHTTTSTSYVSYSDVFDFSGYADGPYTLEIYLSASGGEGYNQTFELSTTSPTLVAADNSAATATGDIDWHLVKTLTFDRSGSEYDNIRFGTNLRATGNTAELRIDLNGATLFTHSTTSTTYVPYSDLFDMSGYADGPYTVQIYLQIGNKKQNADNNLAEVWRTSPTLIASDDNEYSVSGTLEWQLLKSLVFTSAGISYDQLRIDSNLKASGATVDMSIRIDDVEAVTHTTTSSSYVAYSDTIDTSWLSDGIHTLKLYLKTGNKNKPASNSVFELYRTYTYAASGTVASAVLDTGVAGGRWDAVFRDVSLSPGTDTSLEVRASDTPFTASDGTLGWASAGSGDPVLSGLASGRYKQWRITLTPDTERMYTPLLQEVRTYYYGG